MQILTASKKKNGGTMNRAIIGEALASMGWRHDIETNTWFNDKCSGLDFNTAVVYSIRFASTPPPNTGDRVKVLSGPFFDFEGTVDTTDLRRNQVRVIIDIFGRVTPVELQVQELEILR